MPQVFPLRCTRPHIHSHRFGLSPGIQDVIAILSLMDLNQPFEAEGKKNRRVTIVVNSWSNMQLRAAVRYTSGRKGLGFFFNNALTYLTKKYKSLVPQ